MVADLGWVDFDFYVPPSFPVSLPVLETPAKFKSTQPRSATTNVSLYKSYIYSKLTLLTIISVNSKNVSPVLGSRPTSDHASDYFPCLKLITLEVTFQLERDRRDL